MGETTVTTTVDLSDPTAYTELATVGRVYEVGINGAGYMLFDMREAMPDLRYRRQVGSLIPQRFAVGDTPFAEAIERYTFTGFRDFSGGAGQEYFDRPESDPARFYDSEGVDPFTQQGRVELLDSMAESAASTATEVIAVSSNNRQYLKTQNGQVGYRGFKDSAMTTVALTALDDMATDGQKVFIIDNGTLKSGTTSWSALGSITAAEYVAYAGQRICISEIATGATPNQWDTLDEAGARESATPRLTLDTGWSIGKAVGGQGFVWFPAWTNTRSVIYRWQPGTDNAPAVVYEMPEGIGLSARSLFYYQGNLFIRAFRDLNDTPSYSAYIYRAPVDEDGVPIPQLVLKLEDAGVDHRYGGFGADDRFVYFGWDKMNGTHAGIGCIDLASGGYAKWYQGDAAGAVRSIHRWKGYIYFTIDGDSLQRQQLGGNKVSSGYLITSITDKASTLAKLWDTVRVLCDPLLTDQSIVTAASIDHFTTWETITDALVDQTGGIGVDAEWGEKARSVAFKITLNVGTDTTASPQLRLVQVQLHPLGKADQVVVLPINCGDNVSDLRGRPLPENGRGVGAARARTLESLAQTRVKFQDVDYADTEASYIMECQDVQVERVGIRDPKTGKMSNWMVAVVTLRRNIK